VAAFLLANGRIDGTGAGGLSGVAAPSIVVPVGLGTGSSPPEYRSATLPIEAPTEPAGTLYTSASTATLKAIAYESGYTDSSVASATYTIVPVTAAPTFSPGAGTYSTTQTVTLSSGTSGASIRYTTDGSTPSETAGTLYTTPLTVSSTTTVKAIAYESGYTDSSVAPATFTILPSAATPTFSPGAGTYSSAQTVTLSTTTSGASIRYTNDGSTPTETAGTLYTGAITVNSTATLKAIAYESGYTDSSVASATYTIQPPSISGV
jgi:AraC-like DNA-binding protein